MSAPKMPFRINLLEGGSVITADGEYLGTWDVDESDSIYQFTPDGASEPLLLDPFMGLLCEKIESWHRSNDAK